MVDLKNDSNREAIELLYKAYRAFTAGPDEMLEKRGLNRSHHRILYFVGRSPGISVGELLRTLAISKQALNIPLRQLISMDMIKSQKSPDDARSKQLKLTAQGKRLEQSLSKFQVELLSDVFASVGPEAHSGWRRVMKELAQH